MSRARTCHAKDINKLPVMHTPNIAKEQKTAKKRKNTGKKMRWIREIKLSALNPFCPSVKKTVQSAAENAVRNSARTSVIVNGYPRKKLARAETAETNARTMKSLEFIAQVMRF